MRLDAVEVKVSIGGPEVAAALGALGLGQGGQRRTIGFIEDITVGVALPLFHHGVVLRVREVDGGKDDATVKLRPCRQSQLTGSWLAAGKGDGVKLRVEQDWAGARHVLAASCVADVPAGTIASVRAGSGSVRSLFAQGQERFLADCAGLPLNLDALTLLPAIAATRWEKVGLQGLDDVVAERWRVDDLDFLELSVRKDGIEEALAAQADLDKGVRALGLEPDDGESKTERVLAHLVGGGP